MLLRYARVSTDDQNLDLQLDALSEAIDITTPDGKLARRINT